MSVLFLCNILVCSAETYSSITSVSINSVFYWISWSKPNCSTSFQTNPVYSGQTGDSNSQYTLNYFSTNWFQPASSYK